MLMNISMMKLLEMLVLSVKLFILNALLLLLLFALRITAKFSDALFFWGILIVAGLTYFFFVKVISPKIMSLINYFYFLLFLFISFMGIWKLTDFGIFILSLSEKIDMVSIGLFFMFQMISLILFIVIHGGVKLIVFLRSKL